MNELVIETRGLTRVFGVKAAVNGVNLEVPRGVVFAFLGRNGSGKSTTIRMLLGLLPPSGGQGKLLGCDIRALTPQIRERVGYLAEDHPLYGWMTVEAIAKFQRSFYARWNETEFGSVIDHFHLRPDTRVRDLSRGERAGLSLALTLAPDPELMILDDPGMGLDPVARRALIESMIQLTRREDRTIFFSSHDLAEVERVADWLAVLDHGTLRASCRVETFRSRVRQFRVPCEQGVQTAPAFPGLLRATRSGNEWRVVCVQGEGRAAQEPAFLGGGTAEEIPIGLGEAMVSYLGHGGRTTLLEET